MHALTPLGDCLDPLTALVIVFLENKVKFVFYGPNLTKTNSETTKMAEKNLFFVENSENLVKNGQKLPKNRCFLGFFWPNFWFFWIFLWEIPKKPPILRWTWPFLTKKTYFWKISILQGRLPVNLRTSNFQSKCLFLSKIWSFLILSDPYYKFKTKIYCEKPTQIS